MAMTEMNHPFQCIEAVNKKPSDDSNEEDYLLATCGPRLVSVSIQKREIVSLWSPDSAAERSRSLAGANDNEQDDQERPLKKQKVQSGATSPPNIIKLVIAPDNYHAVVVTDDKCLRVFEITQNGSITELSQRFMPKRPCEVQVLPDNATILCGDKFGDVYSLPLLPQEPEPSGTSLDELAEAKQQSVTFKPSASNLTVHTKRNLKSLEAQLKQRNLTPKTKEPLKFEHKLLLGHVSMLTDLSYATQEVDGKHRGYVITADRDEHIRVSRAPPQSHIIEGYCLGHTEFVSKILIIPESNLMISGGGDDWLGVWEWSTFRLRRKIHDFRRRVVETEPTASDLQQNPGLCPVSGMWTVKGKFNGEDQTIVAVACEKASVISWFPLSELLKPADDQDVMWSTEHIGAPVLDVAQIGHTVLVSCDQRILGRERIVALRVELTGSSLTSGREDIDLKKCIRVLDTNTSPVTTEEGLNGFLYTVESLRKRTYKDREEEENGEE